MTTDDPLLFIKSYKKIFRKKGACSCAMYYILDREFGVWDEEGVRGAEPLAGGIMQQGYQCGMLWGSVMATSKEAFRRFDDKDKATAIAISSAQLLLESFRERTGCTDCIDVTKTDWHNKFSIAKFMLTGKFLSCFNLIEDWAPDAIQTARESLSDGKASYNLPPISCAYETANRMGASEGQCAAVAGLAGGMGLSGGGCGALATAIWIRTMACEKDGVKRSFMSNPYIDKVMKNFQAETNYEFLCSKITGRQFKTLDEHTEFIRNGGCGKLMGVLAGA